MDQHEAAAAWFTHSEKVRELALILFTEVEIPIEPKGAADPKALAAMLLVRTISNFEGAIHLGRIGMIVETRTLTRSCIENLFWLGRLATDGDVFVKEMAFDEASSSKRRGKFVFDEAIPLDDAAAERLRETLDKLERQWPKAKSLQAKQVAKGSMVSSFYLLYCQLSADAAHPSFSSLSRYLAPPDVNGARGIDAHPVVRLDEMTDTVHYACMAVIGACVAFSQIAGPSTRGLDINELADEFATLKLATGIA